jgi:hypothetical protein
MAMPTLFAFLSGTAYLGLQALLLKKLTVFCDQSQWALLVHFYLLFITILVATYIVEARPSKHPERWLRRTGLGIVIAFGIAFYALTLWSPENLSPLASAWLGGLILTPASVCSGIAFGKFVQIVLLQHPRSAWAVLCSIAGGALISSQAKYLMLLLGPTLAFVLFLLAFVAILTILPVPTSEDEQPEAW